MQFWQITKIENKKKCFRSLFLKCLSFLWYCSPFFKSIVHRVFAFGFEDVFICWAHFKNVGFVRIFKLLLIFTSKLFFMKNLTSVVIIQQKLPIGCRYYLEIRLEGYNFNQKYDTCNNKGLTRQYNGYTTCLWMRSLELQGRPFKTHCWLFTSGLRRKKIANVPSELLCASVWLIVQIKREEKVHCVKSVQILSFLWSLYSPHSDWIRILRIWTHFIQRYTGVWAGDTFKLKWNFLLNCAINICTKEKK